MDKLINEIYEIIKDYRKTDNKMSVQKIKSWIEQFDENDRDFVLNETKNILHQRYISKENLIIGLETVLKTVSEKKGYNSPAEFLKDCRFIDHQSKGKSQKEFLNLLSEITQTKFGVDILKLSTSDPKYFIYIDDFLCTGDTLYKNLSGDVDQNSKTDNKGWLLKKFNSSTHLDYIEKTNASIILVYFAYHTLNFYKTKKRLDIYFDKKVSKYLELWYFLEIDNVISNENPNLEVVLPIEENQPQLVHDYVREIGGKKGEVFRSPNLPIKENFFSSKENRVRYENILLSEGLKLYNLAGEARDPRMRPLGYTLKSHKNLGFGALCFSYRNVPFNTPMVFWYSSRNWKPLFDRDFTSYKKQQTISERLNEIFGK